MMRCWRLGTVLEKKRSFIFLRSILLTEVGRSEKRLEVGSEKERKKKKQVNDHKRGHMLEKKVTSFMLLPLDNIPCGYQQPF